MTRHWKAGCPADEQLKVIIRQIPDLLAPNLPMDRLKYIFNHVPIFQEYSFDVFRKRFRLAVDEICLLRDGPPATNTGFVHVPGCSSNAGTEMPTSKRPRMDSSNTVVPTNTNSGVPHTKSEEVVSSAVEDIRRMNVMGGTAIRVELSNFPVQTAIKIENNRTKFIALVQPIENATKFVCSACRNELIIAMEWPSWFTNSAHMAHGSTPAEPSSALVRNSIGPDANTGCSSSSGNIVEGVQTVDSEVSPPQFRMRFSLPWEVDVSSLSMSRKVVNESSIIIVECFSPPTPVQIAKADSLEVVP